MVDFTFPEAATIPSKGISFCRSIARIFTFTGLPIAWTPRADAKSVMGDKVPFEAADLFAIVIFRAPAQVLLHKKYIDLVRNV
jgi:hypothetical protein